jgi:hypothetical protein
MKNHLINRAAQILVDSIKEAGYGLDEVQLKVYEKLQEHGFIAIYAMANDRVVATISQDTYSLECGTDFKGAETSLIRKVSQFWNE